jgi:hypothetical protein
MYKQSIDPTFLFKADTRLNVVQEEKIIITKEMCEKHAEIIWKDIEEFNKKLEQ